MICKICKEDKLKEEFHFRQDSQKYRSECKVCFRGKQRDYINNKEQLKRYKADYYLKNKEHINKVNSENQKKKNLTLEEKEISNKKKAEHLRNLQYRFDGHHHTEEAKKKISEKKKEHAAQLRKEGKRHWNYKNGNYTSDKVRSNATLSLDYKNWRTAVYIRDDYTCQDCKVKGGKLNAHHKLKWKDYPEYRYAVDNGITLCFICHHKRHSKVKELI
jgi:hypothetical protein